MQFLAFFSPSSNNIILAVQLRRRGKQFYFTNQIIWKSLDVQTDKLGRYGLVSAKKIMCAAHENWAFFQSKWWNGWNLLGSPICYAQETDISPANRFLHQFPTQSTPSKANFGAKFTSQNLKAGCIKRPLMTLQQKVSLLLLLLPASAPYRPFQSTLHWPGFWWFPLLWSASEGFQSTIHCNQHKKMEIKTDPMDDPDLISSLSISESTDHSSNSNLLFCTLAIMLASNGKKTAPWTRYGLSATAPSKKGKRTVNTPSPNEPEEEVEEVAPPVIVEDSIAEATMSNVVIGTELIPIKRIDAKKKTKLTDANSSLLQSIVNVPPTDIMVDCLRKFCVRESIPGLGSSASEAKCIHSNITAKKPRFCHQEEIGWRCKQGTCRAELLSCSRIASATFCLHQTKMTFFFSSAISVVVSAKNHPLGARCGCNAMHQVPLQSLPAVEQIEWEKTTLVKRVSPTVPKWTDIA